MAGIGLAPGQRVLFFGATRAGTEAAVVTVSGSSDTLPGIQVGKVKTTPLSGFPGKGRATGGVRAHRFLKGEDTLILAWVGEAPPRASGRAGQPVELPPVDERRDGPGAPLSAPIDAIG